MSLNEFNILASNRLGFKIQIKHSYKICELKPAYGLIFQNYLVNYDFWGYGDIDLVYGDILQFLPEKWNKEYDIISNHTEFIPGHLCILKNTIGIITLFQQVKSYKTIFQSPVYHGFDEIYHPVKVFPGSKIVRISKALKIHYHLILSGVIRLIKKSVLYKLRDFRPINFNASYENPKDFSSIVKRNVVSGKLKVWYNISYNCDLMLHEQKISNWQIGWNNGKLKNLTTGKELMYFHFSLSKNSQKFKIPAFSPSIRSFKISKTGIV